MNPDPRSWRGLYAIIDVEACGTRGPIEVARAVLEGGCAVLQLRAKRAIEAETRELAHVLLGLCERASVPFVINDRVGLAAELGAQGAHLGQDDMQLSHARALAPGLCIGLSTHSLDQVEHAQRAGADLIGFGPVFATASKDNPDPVVGPAVLAEAVARARVPVVAIGGIDRNNLEEVIATGAPLVACIGAICKARDPHVAAATLHARITQGPR